MSKHMKRKVQNNYNIFVRNRVYCVAGIADIRRGSVVEVDDTHFPKITIWYRGVAYERMARR